MSRKERRTPRYKVGHIQAVTVVVESAEHSQSAPLPGRLINISRGGARIVLAEPLPLQQAVCLRLECAERGLEILILAEICWARRGDNRQWLLGCEFVPELPACTLEQLFDLGKVERRTFQRQPRELSVITRWQLEGGTMPARLCDVSEGGFCLLTPETRGAGRRLMVSTEAADQRSCLAVPARTCWEVRAGDGYILGCEFTSRDGQLALKNLQPPQTRGEPGPAPTRVTDRLRTLVGGLFGRNSSQPLIETPLAN